jgi:hypothetical protein
VVEVSGGDSAPWIVGVFLGVTGLALVVARLRRRGPPAETPPSDPELVLERLISPSDGVDRFTIELLAEEEGVPIAVVRATLDRLIADGRVRSESDPDGGEVLAWEFPSDR